MSQQGRKSRGRTDGRAARSTKARHDDEGPRRDESTSPLPGFRSEARYLSLVCASALLVYFATMPRTVTLEDSGEFITVAASAGVAHEPGYPTYALLGRLFSLLPVGSIALRVHLLSASAGAAACATLYMCVVLAIRQRVAAMLAAGLLAFSATFWSQAIVAEVYTLHALCFFGLLALCLRLNLCYEQRTLRWAALLYGLALTNHWPLLVLASGSFAILLAVHARRITRQAPMLVGLVLVGLSPYLHLLLAARLESTVSAWGPIESVGELLSYVTRSRYASLEHSSAATLADRLAFLDFFARAAAHELTRPLFALVPIGFLAAWPRLRRDQLMALLWALLSSSALLLLGLQWEFDDIHRQVYLVYQLVPFGICAFFAGCSVLWIVDSPKLREPWRTRGAWALAALAVAGALVGNLRQNDLRRDTLAQDYAHAVLESLPQDSVLVVNADMDTAPIAYAQAIDGVRPDVTVYSRTGYLFENRLADSSRAGWEQRADARLAALVDEHGRVFDSEFGHSGLVQQSFAPTGTLEIRSRYDVADHGLFHQLAERTEPVPDAGALERSSQALEAERAGHYGDQWRYLKEIVMGKFCWTLALAGRTEGLEETGIPQCLRSLALVHAKQGDFERAADLYGQIIDSGYQPPRKRLAGVYNEYFLMRINQLGFDTPDGNEPSERRAAYQRLVDRVLEGVRAYPECDNRVLDNLLTLATMTRVTIPLVDLEREFGHCPALERRLEALRDQPGP